MGFANDQSHQRERCRTQSDRNPLCLSRSAFRVSLPFTDDEFLCKIFFPDIPGFYNPFFQPYLFDPAKVVHLHIVWIFGGAVDSRSKIGARELIAVEAEINALFFHTIKGSATFRSEMKVFSILLPTPQAGNILRRDSQLFMNQSGQFIRQIIYI